MADPTYPLGGQGIRREQGGKSLVVGSSGTITIESGGTLAFDSGSAHNVSGTQTILTGGVLNVDSGGAMTIDDGGYVAVPVTVKSTSTGTITNFGVTTFGSTSADSYTLAAPTVAGLRKTLVCSVHGATTTASVITTASTNSYIRGSSSPGDTHTLTFLDGGTFAELVSVSTAEWRVTAMSAADVAIS